MQQLKNQIPENRNSNIINIIQIHKKNLYKYFDELNKVLKRKKRISRNLPNISDNVQEVVVRNCKGPYELGSETQRKTRLYNLSLIYFLSLNSF